MKLVWTEPAQQDLRDLRDYIAADSDFHAADFIANIISRAERLMTLPMCGRVVPEAHTENIRENTVSKLSHHVPNRRRTNRCARGHPRQQRSLGPGT